MVKYNWSHAALSPDSQYAACGSMAGPVLVWDTRSHEVVTTLTGHEAPVSCTAWSMDGRRVATCDGNGMLIIWQ